jgi:hypothetical protein
MNNAQPIPCSAAAHAPASRPLALLEARRQRDELRSLLRTEQSAMADFLVALADFDRRRGWEPLGHATLFSFLITELQLSNSAAYYRMSAARLLQDFPEVIQPLREGRLCLSTVAELAKVLTEGNRAVVVPRFFGLSAREAQALVAELQPRPAPPLRDLIISVTREVSPTGPSPGLRLELPLPPASQPATQEIPPSNPNADSESLLTSEVPPTHPVRVAPRPDQIEPLTGSLTRLHFTVSREVVKKVEAARRGLGHAIPNASLEQVLEAALDLLLEKQAKARGQVKRPRAAVPVAPAAPAATSTPNPTPTATATEPPAHRREGHRRAIPAAIRRAVWARDAGRCSWPLDGGGCCGSTLRLELDHIVPWAAWGGETEGNLRLTCAAHNRLAALQVFGEGVMRRYRGVREAVAVYGAAAQAAAGGGGAASG